MAKTPRWTGRDLPIQPFRLSRIRALRPQESFEDRLRLLRRRWRTLIRVSLGSAVAFLLATHVLGHQQAFFAPIAAVITIIAGAGARVRTMLELVLGVATGVLVGELIILGIGRGWWQMALVVALAVTVATLVGLKGIALNQAASSSVLLAAVLPAPGAGNPAATRFLDALVGGVVGLVMSLLVPRNPVRDIDREVQALLRRLASVLSRTARALRTDDASLADLALQEARESQPLVDNLNGTALNAAEIARLSPVRWRQRDHVALYVATIRDIDNAVRDARVLARRTSALLRHGEPVPPELDDAIDDLARAVGIFADDLPEQDDFDEARRALAHAAQRASHALPSTMTMNAGAVAAQVRSLAADLLYASGYSREEIDEVFDDEGDGPWVEQ